MRCSRRAAVVGAGIMGLLTCEALLRREWQVDLYDGGGGGGGCSRVAAAMLAPFSELETADPQVAQMGQKSLALWEGLVERWAPQVFFQRTGTLVVAHASDAAELDRLKRRIEGVDPSTSHWIDRTDPVLESLSPGIRRGIRVLGEGQIDGSAFMDALIEGLIRSGMQFKRDARVERLQPHTIDGTQYEWVVDCRGLGAAIDLPALRAVRGEILAVESHEVTLPCPVRLMHPRYPLYIVPRPNGRFLIGATSVESADTGPVTVRSALELLSAAYSVHSGFGEAHIIGLSVGLRPAFPDHLPRIVHEAGLIRVNGLYRHGFLVGPALADTVATICEESACVL